MVTGLFRNSGFFMGEKLHRPTQENPTGYFEDAAINNLNNRIISRYVPGPVQHDGIDYQCDAPGARNGWLARIPLSTRFEATPQERKEIDDLVARRPFCLKDTRFCYLLDLWRERAEPARMICVFRAPEVAATSILRSCQMRSGLFDYAISVNQAFEIWSLMYTHVLRRLAVTGNWLFVHYEDVLNSSAFNTIEAFAGVPIDRTFPKQQLNRSRTELSAPATATALYDELRALAVAGTI